MPTRGKQCAASAYLLYNADSFEVTLFESIEQQDHEQILEGVEIKEINSATKEAIYALLMFNVTVPKSILSQLECIEQKAPRGRPAKANKALEYQAPVTQIPETQASVATTSAKASKRKAQDNDLPTQPKKRGRPPSQNQSQIPSQ